MQRAMQTIGWGLYLASSWTWCIGMFLPIVLLRWWGWPGFLAFAVPNVIGCSLFGYVLSPDSSVRFMKRFRPWIMVFAAATIAYQMWFLNDLARANNLDVMWVLMVLLALALAGVRAGSRMLPVAWLAWPISVVLFVALGTGSLASLPVTGTLPPLSLAWAAPFMALGFLLCPYLDPTFHLALQRSPSRHAFAVFGVTFAVMLLFTAAMFDPATGLVTTNAPLWLGASVITWQWIIQCGFTIGAHVDAVHAFARGPDARHPRGTVMRAGARAVLIATITTVAGLVLLLVLKALEPELPALAPTLLPPAGATATAGEPTYLRWLGLYGVLFPAIVLLGLRRVPFEVQATAIFGAALLAEFGMIGGRTHLLGVAVLVVVLAALWPSRKDRETAEIPAADPR